MAQGAILHSPDGGFTWERQRPSLIHELQLEPPLLRAVAFPDTTRGVIVGARGALMIIRDGGRTWDSRRTAGTAGSRRPAHAG